MNEILALQSREQKARNLNKKQQQQQQQSSEPRTKFLLAKDNIIKVRTKKIKLPGICLETRKENSEKSRSKSKSNSNALKSKSCQFFEREELEDGEEGIEEGIEVGAVGVFLEIEVAAVHLHSQERVDKDEQEEQKGDVNEGGNGLSYN